MLSSTLIRDPARLEALHPAWSALVARTEDNELNLHPDWLGSWWSVFGSEGRALRVLAFFDGEELVGMLPLLSRPHQYLPGLTFDRLEMLGSGEDPADETCGDYLGLIAAAGREKEVADAVAKALASDVAGPWHELVISSLNGESTMPGLLRDALRARGLPTALETYSTSPYIPLPATWDDYLGELNRSKRGRIRKALREYEKWSGGPPIATRVKTRDELDEGKRILMDLHRERWGGDGVFGSAKFRAFHDCLMVELLERDALELGWLSVNDEPVVAFYNFRHNGRVCFYQGGRRLDVPRKVRVGLVMHAHLIQNSIQDGMREYDFLGGTSRLKEDFATASRPLLRLRAAPESTRERARCAAQRGLTRARELRDWAERESPLVKNLIDRFFRSSDA